ncbi:MAG TPA: J domain-containing protein [Rhizomicrobium sp.]|nr:J domain-containing protein [Rhizomicrobium sp.]
MTRPTTRKFLGDIRIKPVGKAVVVEEVRTCAMAGCEAEGVHRVPKSRDNISEQVWVCLAHARAHNESWDYFAGMSEGEIQKFRVDAQTGHRPTWPMGKRGAKARSGAYTVKDTFGDLGGDAAPTPRPPVRRRTGVQIQALSVMNLEESATLLEIKARYKELVKRFHPDANGGDRGAEERLKQVIKAYAVLKRQG